MYLTLKNVFLLQFCSNGKDLKKLPVRKTRNNEFILMNDQKYIIETNETLTQEQNLSIVDWEEQTCTGIFVFMQFWKDKARAYEDKHIFIENFSLTGYALPMNAKIVKLNLKNEEPKAKTIK